MTLQRFKYACGMFAVLVATYRLPFLVPPHPNASVSYLVGFNNHVAMLVLLAGSLVFALVSKGANLQLAAEGAQETRPLSQRWSTYVLAATFLLTAAILGVFWSRVRGDGMPAPFEAAYFMDRYHEMLRGGRIYRDFTFDYGPLMFFPPVWFYRITGVTFLNAYFVMLALQWGAGLAALWFVLKRVASSPAGRVLTFLVVALVWLTSTIDLGSNYTPLRFLASSVAAALLDDLYKRGQKGWVLCLAGVAAFTLLFFYSPEQGISFLIATVLFFTICVRDRRVAVALVAFAIGCGCVIAIGAHVGMLRSLFSFGGGNYDLPVLPSRSSAAVLLGLICAACLVVTSFRGRDTARVELYLICLAIAGCPAAFGRADPGHMFINTVPALLVVLMVLLQSVNAVMAVTVVVSCLYLQVAFKAHFLKLSNAIEWVRTNSENSGFDNYLSAATKLTASRTILAPFAFPVTIRVIQGSPVHSGQFFGFAMPNRTLAELKVVELESNPVIPILVPKTFDRACAPMSPKEADGAMQTVLVTRFVPPMLHSADVGSVLCDYVRSHYVPVEGTPSGWSYELLRPKGSQ